MSYARSPLHQSHALNGIPNIGNQNGAPKKSKEDPEYGRIDEYYNENPKASLKDGVRALKIANQQSDGR